ncbi:hypothetical protein HK104_001359 [Borealophlyctis nickersoniae]|nr:hypothetical protein HK104_001359 [Borealophlyctis nickersoniae]
MSVRNRKQTRQSDPVAPYEKELLEWLNNDPESLLVMCRYFANAKMALHPRAIDVDSAGFTLQYIDKNLEGELVRKDVRVQFDEPAGTLEEAKRRIRAMMDEARKGFNLVVDKTYVPPGREPPRVFIPPEMAVCVVAAGLWSIFAAFAFQDRLPVRMEIWRIQMGGPEIFFNIVVGALVIHAVECLVALGVCVWARIPVGATIMWLLTILPLGLASLKPLVKTAVSRRNLAQLEAAQKQNSKSR